MLANINVCCPKLLVGTLILLLEHFTTFCNAFDNKIYSPFNFPVMVKTSDMMLVHTVFALACRLSTIMG
jgi:hypothetical protein